MIKTLFYKLVIMIFVFPVLVFSTALCFLILLATIGALWLCVPFMKVPYDQIDNYVDSATGVFYGVFCVGDNWVDRCVCLMHFVPDHKSKEAEIALSTLPDYRGNGYAKKLLTGGIFMANAYLMEKVVMSGLSSNKAIVVLA